MPARNLTVYARWDINSFYISLDLNGGQINGQATQTIYGTFGEALKTPSNPSKTGYDFIGWFSDEELTKPFEFTTMPNYNQIVYAKWEIIKLTIILDVVGGTFTSQTTFNIDYGTSIEKPIEVPKKEGYKFEYWHISYLEEEFNFYNTFTRNTVLAAKWTPVTYTLSFVTNTFQKIEPITLYYLDVIEYPTDLVYTNHKFMGWFLDAEFNTPANTVMNMQSFDMTVYAKWTPKENIVLNIPVKEFDYGDIAVYKDYSKLTGFTLYYLVNGEWSRKEPSEVGSYDIKITRDEDVDYASFEKVYSKVLVINPVKRDFSLLIFLFYFLTAIEIATIFFVKRIRKMKRSRNYSVVFGTWFISTSQFVHIIISGTIFLIFFGYLFYELLKTHRTANNENFEKSKYDTRERFKDDLEFQINAAVNPDYEYETKTKESFGDKYSAEDIEKMLINDTYNEDRLKYKNKSNNNDKFRLEEDNNTQFNINNLKNETLPDENSLNKEESKEQNSTNGYKFEEENINYEDENEKYRREMYDYDINEQFDDETKETTVLEDSSVNEESFDEDVNDTLKRQNREIEELLKEIESQNSDEENN
ncbi:MAG: InlB B-repeat-containing protein [Clostridia bacterium]|nr:InlB B-repeat-containing protein [Clostridia bacterium]